MSHIRRNDGPNRIFHVTARVNWREWHLESDTAKAELANLLAHSAAEFGISLLGCVFMSNHMHCVVQSPPEEVYRRLTGRRTACRHFRAWPKTHQNSTVLGQFMRVVRRTMSVRRQEALGLSGRFWESAYDARPITNAVSLVVRIAYDHRNPVTARMVDKPEDYAWSTAHEWASGEPGRIPLVLPDPLPFGLRRDQLGDRIRRYQRMRELDDVREELEELLRDAADADAIQHFLEERDLLPECGIDAAERRRKTL